MQRHSEKGNVATMRRYEMMVRMKAQSPGLSVLAAASMILLAVFLKLNPSEGAAADDGGGLCAIMGDVAESLLSSIVIFVL